MNIHVPQTLQAIAELHVLLNVNNNFIAPNELPSTSFIQDTLLGAFLISGQDVLLTRDQAFQMLARHDLVLHLARLKFGPRLLPIPAVQYRRLGRLEQRWTGAQIVSAVLPEISVGDSGECMELQRAVVVRGHLIAGQLTKRDLGAGRGNMLHRIFLGHNPKEFMNAVNWLLGTYMAMRGFSVGLGDLRIRVGSMPQYADARGPTLVDRLRHLRTMCQVHVESSIRPDNALRQMFVSGSKGKALNATQIVCAVGPQDLDGKSPPLWLGGRSLPCFQRGDQSPGARGYVASGYLKGLEPAELFFHCAAARASMVVSKLAPALSGELQRLMGECLKALRVDYAGRVVGERNEITQFVYADDGLDWTGQPVEPGTPVGIIAAQSLSEQLTQVGVPAYALTYAQKSLDSFHNVGESNAIPRLYELFYARDRGVVRAEFSSSADARAFARAVSGRPVLISAQWATPADAESLWARRWMRVYGQSPAWKGRKAVKLVLSREAFFFETLREFCAWLGEPAMHSHQAHDPALEALVFIDPASVWALLKKLEPNPNKARVRVVGERVVEADGLGLLEAGAKLHGVAVTSLSTTNVRDIERFMGIEAARQSLFEQATRLDAFQGVSRRHLSVLCDAMCANGELRATRYTGMGARTKSTLGRTVFQSPMPTFINAAVYGHKEEFGNISACLITGERVPVGSGSRDFALVADDGGVPAGVKKNPFEVKAWYMNGLET